MLSIETEQVYLFKKVFCQCLLEESEYIATKRKNDLLKWLTEFFDYELITKKGCADKIIIHQIYKDYEKMPKKQYSIEKRTEIRKKREEYLEKFILSLFSEPGSEEYLTYSYIARNIPYYSGVQGMFSGISYRTIAISYVKPVLHRVANFIPPKHWVWFECYEKVDEEATKEWIEMLREEERKQNERLIEENRKLYLCEDSDLVEKDPPKKKFGKDNFYKKAIDRFKAEYGDFPVQSYRWVLKEEYRNKINTK